MPSPSAADRQKRGEKERGYGGSRFGRGVREGGERWGKEGREVMKVNSPDGLFDITGRDDALRHERANNVTIWEKAFLSSSSDREGR